MYIIETRNKYSIFSFHQDWSCRWELGSISDKPKPSFTQTEHRLITAEYRTITDRLITGTTAKKYAALKQGDVTTFGYYNPDDPTKPIAAKVPMKTKATTTTNEQ